MAKRIENWPVFLGLAVVHVGALAVFLPGMVSWSAIAVMLVLVYVTGALGGRKDALHRTKSGTREEDEFQDE